MDQNSLPKAALPPHVLIFPCPAQGHVNSMLKLAELLCHVGIHVTFIVTHNIHRRLLRHSTAESRFARYSGFRFEPVSDGLPEDHPRSGDKVFELGYSIRARAKPILRELLMSDRAKKSDARKAITCIVSDIGLLSLSIDVGEEFGIPTVCYCTSSLCDFWAYLCVPKLIDAGELPFTGNNLDVPLANIPGMEGLLRRRDLSSFCRGDLTDRGVQMILNECLQTPRAHALILNTFEELEGPLLTQVRSQCPKVYTIGPLHEHLKTKLSSLISSNDLWKADRSCIAWLDAQPLRSVIYVSFGSLSMVTNDQLMEFWHGLTNSGKRFLWVIRRDSLLNKDSENQFPSELLDDGERGRGYIVGWAPQEEVLAHKVVGGFLTHSGWNSTLESVAAGVPMICWPCFGDQHVNSRFVEEVWKLGLDMKDTCDRIVIEKMVRDLMDVRREEFMQSADRMAKLAKKAISEGGSSHCNLDCLVEDITLMSAD